MSPERLEIIDRVVQRGITAGGFPGASVIIGDIDEAAAIRTAGDIAASGGKAIACMLDVTKPDAAAAAVDLAYERCGRLDILVNNAGITTRAAFLDMTLDAWESILRVNLTGAMVCSQAAARSMVAAGGGGCIVNIASISGLRASTLRVAYGTSKAALIHLTKQYAAELGNYGVRVNTVCPGPVETEMAKLVHSVAIRSDYLDTIPLGRYGSPQEMAQTVGFLCSDQASYINGQFLAVDGGFDASGVGLPTLRRNHPEISHVGQSSDAPH